ncbi:MAG: zinc ribbon domain-containing protein [Acidobacteria bacterium]|nr:zinc ribbon domain-containing protein [Acidobacteriota bacterium]
MPLYEYRCSQCDRVFEVIQKFSDEPLTVHEGCGGAVERLISAPGLQFKGSGWYITDYARSGSSKGGASKSSESKTESKSDSTPAKSDTSSTSTKKD